MNKNSPLLQKIFLNSPTTLRNIQASLYSISVSKKKYGPIYEYWCKLLSETQWWDDAKLKQLQNELLLNFLGKVQQTTPFYKKHLTNLAITDNITDPFELLKIFPLLNKLTVKKYYDTFLSNPKNETYLSFFSSGTTGTALKVYLDSFAYQREYAFRSQFMSFTGVKRKSRFAYFIGNRIFSPNRNSPPFSIIDFYENGIFFSIFHMSNKNLIYYIKSFNQFRPQYVKGYPSALYTFAYFVYHSKSKIHRPVAIFAASEVLRDYQLKLIEEVFQAPVYQWYGQVETTINIHECEKRRLHVKEEYGFLELLNSQGENAKPGEIASAIGTSWGNIAFPLIRYDTGDNMILSDEKNCSCGRGGRIIKKILGRDEDVIITPDGNILGRLDFVFKPVDTVKESQIIQVDENTLKIKLVPLENFKESDKKIITEKLIAYVGTKFNLKFEEVDELEKGPSGKTKYVISNLKFIKDASTDTKP